MTSPELKARYFKLMQRAVQILSLLPDPATIDTSDEATITDATMLLTEFNKVDTEMKELEAAVKCSH